MPDVIEVQALTRIAGEDAPPWHSRIRWTSDQPLSVTLITPEEPHSDEVLVWEFARDLLADGLVGMAGHGDVRVCPGLLPSLLLVELSSPDGEVVLEMDKRPVIELVARSYAAVPRGCEVVDVDAELAQLLGGGAAA